MTGTETSLIVEIVAIEIESRNNEERRANSETLLKSRQQRSRPQGRNSNRNTGNNRRIRIGNRTGPSKIKD